MSDSDSMVERVSRAIWDAGVAPIEDGDMARAIARAAIAAMRVPTVAMEHAADPEYSVSGIWEQMIDAALKESP